MKDRFDELWLILESQEPTGDEVSKQVRKLIAGEHHIQPGFQIVDGPEVVLWTSDPDRLRFLLNIKSDAPYFAGHFPGNPILPGVIQLHWAVLLARRHLHPASHSVDVRRVKFRSIVTPPRLVELRLKSESGGRVEFLVGSQETIHSQGALEFPENS